MPQQHISILNKQPLSCATDELLISFIEKKSSQLKFIVGPKHVNKTALIKQLTINYQYVDYDNINQKNNIDQCHFDESASTVIIDNIYKKDNWIEWINQIIDNQNISIVLFSHIRLDYFLIEKSLIEAPYKVCHWFPMDCVTLNLNDQRFTHDEILEKLLTKGGFPDSMTNKYESNNYQQRLDSILRYDLIDVMNFQDIKSMEQLIELLKKQVGQTVSYANLARQLDKDPKTIKQWLATLEDLYIVFKVSPYSNQIPRSIIKESKYYFFDSLCIDDQNKRLENLVAFCLYNYEMTIRDNNGEIDGLYFVKDKQGHEIDFLINFNSDYQVLVDATCGNIEPSKSLKYYAKVFSKDVKKVQLVRGVSHNLTYKKSGIKVVDMGKWLCNLKIQKPHF